MKQTYVASKSRTQNRPGWSISFRHPLRTDTKGKPGLKMRRGLGTNDEQDAEELVEQMNEILADESWWNASKRGEAATRFHKVVVDAFFDEIQAGRFSPESVREAEIPLPGSDQGYSRVQFVGTTGAGKTSLVRQLIGSDPEEDRFPSTAPAKTTIADLELVQAEGEFKAVITFFSEFQIQAYVEECLMAASVAAFDGATDAKIADRLLNHSDQKFRLSYVLGAWPDASPNEEEFSFDDDAATVEQVGQDSASSYVERLQSFVTRIKALAVATEERLREELGALFDDSLKNDRATIESWFEEFICEADGSQAEEFFGLTHDIMDEIRVRFDRIEHGDLVRTRSEWPEKWTFACADRNEFIKQVRWFSGNYWREFGRLLTPIVQGVRVKGPLFPSFDSIKPRLVLIDGQGLGHTPDSSTSVPTDITRRFASVDVILLVDNAQQPMLAASQSVLRIVASSGFHHKLAVAFTHFDLIKGDNLRTLEDKRAHVMGSVGQAISSLRDIIGAPVARAVEQSLPDRCFMLGGIDRSRNQPLPAKPGEYVRKQMLDLIALCEHAIEPVEAPEAAPIYDPTGIGFAVREAVAKFIGPWTARLGLGSYSGVPREHYNRIKALNRRIAGEMAVEYDSLRPVADLVARLSESISLFLDKPIKWTRNPVDDAEAEAAISQVRRNIAGNIHEIALRRLVEQHLSEWRKAYEIKGRGSAHDRSLAMKHIYESAAPLPDTVMTEQASRFVVDIRRFIEVAIKEAGGGLALESFS